MSAPPSTSALPTGAAGLAGSWRILLLALTGVCFLAGGIGLGFFLQNWRSPSAGSHAAAGHAAAHGDGSHTSGSPLQPLEGTEAVVPGDHDGAPQELPDPHPPAADSHSASEPAAPASGSASAKPRPFVDDVSLTMPEAPRSSQGTVADRMALADKQLLVGNYRVAHETYTEVAGWIPPSQQADLCLRLALCEESLGDLKQSQANYRKVVELRPALELRDAAVLGQARLWSLAGRNELASSTLYRAILGGNGLGGGARRSQIPHELAVLLAQRTGHSGQVTGKLENFYSDTALISPQLQVEPYQVLMELTSGPLTPAQEQLVPVHDVSVVERFHQAPDEIYVNVRTERITALELIRRVANRTGYTVQLTEEARMRLQEHTLLSDCMGIPMGLVLDAVLEPFEAIWRVQENTLSVLLAKHASAPEIEAFRNGSAMRALKYACAAAPDHPWAAASMLELGRLTARDQSLETATKYLATMVDQFPRSEFQAIAWFNLSKLELQQGHLDAALKGFHRAADLLMGHPLEPLAYLYAGRVLMESDQPREAIASLTRALVLAVGSPFEAMATLQLSSAYLMLEHYQRANEILIEHRECFEVTAEKDQAAFLAGLIQYLGTKDERERFRAGTTLVSAMTNLHPEKCFGGHWYWLAGQAYRDFGMRSQEIAVFRASLSSRYSYPLQNRIRQTLLDEAPELLAELQPQTVTLPRKGRPGSLYFQTRLKEALATFHQQGPDVSLRMTRDLATQEDVPDDVRRGALRLMGQIYQSLGEHERAVQCFSGVIPDENSPTPPPTAALPFPLRGVQ